MNASTTGGRWHAALAFAVTGRREDGWGSQAGPDVPALARVLSADGPEPLVGDRRRTKEAGRPWPHPVPPELMSGLGYAQFVAALGQLLVALDLGVAEQRVPAAAATPAPGPALRRLLDEVPPHHGS